MHNGPTRDQLEGRLSTLKQEYAAGQQMAADLDKKRANLEQTLLRISGAIQVIEELLDGQGPDTPRPPADQAGT